MNVHAYAVDQPGGPVRTHEYEAGPLGPLEVEIEVTHCGICQTDVAMVDNEYGISRYPLVAGHEAVGVITALGAEVGPGLSIGQRAGIGATPGSCMACEWCLSGQQNLCPTKDTVVLRGLGGAFASRLRASDWRHVLPIPESIASGHAAPLLCAGTTVFSPLVRNGVRPTDRVAVAGIGGLGHLALQFLAKWGCHVTAISSSRAKEADARGFGAHDFVTGDDLGRVAGSFDFVLSTIAANLPWDDYLRALRPHGTLCMVGVFPGSMSVQPMSLVPGERRLVGGVTGTPMENRQMLEFAARHGIKPQTETFPAARLDEALDHVRRGKAHYRAVLEF